MSKPQQQRAVCLVGFMGAGKSAVGRVLAKNLGWRFADLDDQIERAAGRSIASIFETGGEVAFRELESEELAQSLKKLKTKPTVLAVGGGAYVQRENAEKFRQAAVPVIFLDAPLEELLRRCREQAGQARPLLDSGPEALSVLYAERRPLYLAAEVTVQTSGKSVAEVADEAERWLRQELRI